MLKIVRTISELRAAVAEWRQSGHGVALVPTMGALHEGHLTLVRTGLTRAARVVVSIFVNPTQFAPHEDLDRYPRDEAGDVAKLAGAGASLVWAPTVDEMYPEDAATRIEVQGAALPLEGEFRPHHFGGVATVCCKLFSAVDAGRGAVRREGLSAAGGRSPDGAGSQPAARDHGRADGARGRRFGAVIAQRVL